MTDLSQTIIPKSTQLNADDLIAGPMTIRISKVSANPSSAEQPICIYFDGDGGKPYLPCKSMRRVLVQVWGKDGSAFVGRSLTLYRDAGVTWGGLAVGGIRISHMSDIDAPVTMALTATKQSRKPFTVKPLAITAAQAPAPKKGKSLADHKADASAAAEAGQDVLEAWWTGLPDAGRANAALKAHYESLKAPAPGDAASDTWGSGLEEANP